MGDRGQYGASGFRRDRESGARVLRGEQPRNIPLEEVAVKKLVLNHEVARALGITFPPDIVRVSVILPLRQILNRDHGFRAGLVGCWPPGDINGHRLFERTT